VRRLVDEHRLRAVINLDDEVSEMEGSKDLPPTYNADNVAWVWGCSSLPHCALRRRLVYHL